MSTVIIVGNPKPRSRTAQAATMLANALTGKEPDTVIDVINLGAGLLRGKDPAVIQAVETVTSANLIIVASPTFKATYSGLLKLFLDQFDIGKSMTGIVAVPMMLGAGPAHAMAPDFLLKPVLVELGATCPAPGLYLLDQTYQDGFQIGQYVRTWRHILSKSMRDGRIDQHSRIGTDVR